MIRKILHIATTKKTEFHNITKEVQDFVDNTNLKNGIITVRTMHTTSSIYINENEKGILKDIEKLLSKIIPDKDYYHHDDFSKRSKEENDEYGDRKNAYSHLKSMLIGHDVTLAVVNAKLTLGTWQSIFFLELDGPRTDRKIELLAYCEEKYN
jgi:secondary thiamine-phosphate synthase enzyme